MIKQVKIIPPTNTRNISGDLKLHSHFHQKIQNSSGTGFFVWYVHDERHNQQKLFIQTNREGIVSPPSITTDDQRDIGLLSPSIFLFLKLSIFFRKALNWSMMPLLVCALPHRCVTDPSALLAAWSQGPFITVVPSTLILRRQCHFLSRLKMQMWNLMINALSDGADNSDSLSVIIHTPGGSPVPIA